MMQVYILGIFTGFMVSAALFSLYLRYRIRRQEMFRDMILDKVADIERRVAGCTCTYDADGERASTCDQHGDS